MTRRVLLISHDVVGRNMAGPGIRAWEMARVLADQHSVTLIAPQPIDRDDAPFTTGAYAWGNPESLAAWLRDADVVIANGYVLLGHPELARIPQPLALDLYDPVLLENLELFRSAPEAERTRQTQQDVTLLQRQLAAGDFFVCATERQRDLLLGALMAAGRITPGTTDSDPQLRSLIDVAPFGLPDEPPIRQAPALRGVVPGIGDDDLIVLWTGGLWDWLDPLTLIRAMPQVVAQNDRVRLVFLAGQHPGHAARMRMPDQARALAAKLGLLDRYIFFYDHWIPYERHADFLLDADVAVSLHRNHLETRYAAVRSRFLDHLWAGLPSIVSDGDAAAELVRRYDLGIIVADGDTEGVATALIQLLSDAAYRQQCGAQARALAIEYTWGRVMQPLIEFCRRPSIMREQPEQPETPALAQANTARDQAIAHAEERWKVQPQPLTSSLPLVGQIKQRANTLTRWYVQTIVEQQNAFNAATVQALHQIAASIDRRYSESLEEMSDLRSTAQSLSRQLTALQERIDQIDTRLNDIDSVQLAIAQELATPAETED